MKDQRPHAASTQELPQVTPETLEGLREMGRRLEERPDFLRAMHRRLHHAIHGHLSRHDH